MRKLASAVVVLLVIVLLAAPGIAGFAVEGVIEDRAVMYNEEYADFFELKIESYDRSWFGSDAIASIKSSQTYQDLMRANLESDPNMDPVVIEELMSLLETQVFFDVSLQHGPVLFSDGMRLGLGSAVIELDAGSGEMSEVKEALGVSYLLRQYSHISFGGVISFNGDMPAFSYQRDTTITDFSGMEYSGVADIYSGEVGFLMTAEELAVDALAGRTTISGISYSGEHVQLQPSVWVGDAQISVAAIVGKDAAENEVFNLQNLSLDVRADADASGQMANIDGLYSIESVNAAGDLNIADTTMKISFGQIDIEALNTLVEINNSGGWQNGMTDELRGAIYEMSAGSPVISFGPLDTLWQDEKLSTGMTISVDGSVLPDYESFNPMDTLMWSRLISSDAYIDMSDAMAVTLATEYARSQIVASLGDQAPTTDPAEIDAVAAQQGPVLLYSFTQQGVLKKTETGYTSKFIYKDGQAIVNDMPIPIFQQ